MEEARTGTTFTTCPPSRRESSLSSSALAITQGPEGRGGALQGRRDQEGGSTSANRGLHLPTLPTCPRRMQTVLWQGAGLSGVLFRVRRGCTWMLGWRGICRGRVGLVGTVWVWVRVWLKHGCTWMLGRVEGYL